jgi:hypothetical protein
LLASPSTTTNYHRENSGGSPEKTILAEPLPLRGPKRKLGKAIPKREGKLDKLEEEQWREAKKDMQKWS